MQKMLVIVALCLVGIAVAQQPKACITPPSWEANVFDYNEQQRFRVRARLSYDANNHRERLVEEFEDPKEDDYYDIISLYDAQIEFVYNYRARNCTRRPLTRQWRDFGIRSDARSLGEAYLGTSALPGLGLLVTIWADNFTTPDNDTVRSFGVWTYQVCLPVSRTLVSSKYGRSHISFFDVTAGIRDPNVFIPRRECLSEQEYAMRDVLFGKPKPSKRFQK